MLFPPRFFLLACIYLLTALSFLAQARAGVPGFAWTPPTLSAIIKDEGATAAGFVRRVYVSCGTNQFAFTLPADFNLGTADTQKLVLVSTDYRYSITLQLVGPVPAPSAATQPASFRREVLAQYAGARITDEFSRNVANHDGPAFDLVWRNSAGTAQAIRTAFVPTRAGLLQITLLTTADKFAEGQQYFDFLLLTVQTNEGGKIEPAMAAGCG